MIFPAKYDVVRSAVAVAAAAAASYIGSRRSLPVLVVVVVLALTRIIKSVVTGQAPVALELRNTPRKKHKQIKGGKLLYAYDITADVLHANTRNMKKK